MKAFLRFYPAAWRARYEAEVAQMLDDSASRPADVPNLLRGAFEAHRHPGRLGLPAGGIRRWFTREHIAGVTAACGGSAWLATYVALWLAAMRMSPNPDLRTVGLLVGAGPLLVIAIAGLLPRSLERGRDRVLAAVALVFGLTGAALMSAMLLRNGLSPDVRLVSADSEPVMFAGTALVLLGSLASVAGMWGRAIASRRACAYLAGACVLDLAFLAIWFNVGFIYEVTSFAGAAAGMLVAAGWISVGWSAMRQSEFVLNVPIAGEGPAATA